MNFETEANNAEIWAVVKATKDQDRVHSKCNSEPGWCPPTWNIKVASVPCLAATGQMSGGRYTRQGNLLIVDMCIVLRTFVPSRPSRVPSYFLYFKLMDSPWVLDFIGMNPILVFASEHSANQYIFLFTDSDIVSPIIIYINYIISEFIFVQTYTWQRSLINTFFMHFIWHDNVEIGWMDGGLTQFICFYCSILFYYRNIPWSGISFFLGVNGNVR